LQEIITGVMQDY